MKNKYFSSFVKSLNSVSKNPRINSWDKLFYPYNKSDWRLSETILVLDASKFSVLLQESIWSLN